MRGASDESDEEYSSISQERTNERRSRRSSQQFSRTLLADIVIGSSTIRRLGLAFLVPGCIGCGAIGAGRALDEAAEVVARLPCPPDDLAPASEPCRATPKARFHAAGARAYLDEAIERAHHGDHAQAERFAVLARKAAEEAIRTQEGPP
jgi:hypothetical protein